MKHRDSNIELLRIIAMLMIILLHANYSTFGPPSSEDIRLAPVFSFGRVFAEQLCIVGVNVFVLISGWFGIKPSIKGVCSLLYQAFFWGIAVVLVGYCFGLTVSIKSLIKLLWFGSAYWFVIAYLGLYVLSPVLNKFVETASLPLFVSVLFGFYSVEFVYGWIAVSPIFNQGYSIISFIGLYLLARYLRIYSKTIVSIKLHLALFLLVLFTFIPSLLSFLGYKNGWPQLRPLSYDSPFVITTSVFFLIIFTKIRINSTAINWVASSVFSAYLIHQHPLIVPYFNSLVKNLYSFLTPFSFVIIIVLLSLVMLLVCVTLDKIRIRSWRVVSSSFLDSLIRKIECKVSSFANCFQSIR